MESDTDPRVPHFGRKEKIITHATLLKRAREMPDLATTGTVRFILQLEHLGKKLEKCSELALENRPEIGIYSRQTRTARAPPNAYQVLKPITTAVTKNNDVMHRVKAGETAQYFKKILPPPTRPKSRSIKGSFAVKTSARSFQLSLMKKKPSRRKFYAGLFDDRQEERKEVMSGYIPEETSTILNQRPRLLRRPKLPTSMYNLPLIYADEVREDLEDYLDMQSEEPPVADDLVPNNLTTFRSDDPIAHKKFYQQNFPLLLRKVPKGIYLRRGTTVEEDVSVYRAISTPDLHHELFEDVPQKLPSDPKINRLLKKVRRKLEKLKVKEQQQLLLAAARKTKNRRNLGEEEFTKAASDEEQETQEQESCA